MAPPRVVLIDGTGLVFRAFFALPQTLATRDGRPTNASFGFAMMFRRILRGRPPTYGAVVFDAGGATFRHELDPSYKRRRPKMAPAMRAQLADIEALVEAHGFPILRIPDSSSPRMPCGCSIRRPRCSTTLSGAAGSGASAPSTSRPTRPSPATPRTT